MRAADLWMMGTLGGFISSAVGPKAKIAIAFGMSAVEARPDSGRREQIDANNPWPTSRR